jgi:hypothetical protein
MQRCNFTLKGNEMIFKKSRAARRARRRVTVAVLSVVAVAAVGFAVPSILDQGPAHADRISSAPAVAEDITSVASSSPELFLDHSQIEGSVIEQPIEQF